MSKLLPALRHVIQKHNRACLGPEVVELHFGWMVLLWGIMLWIPFWRDSHNPIVVAQKEIAEMNAWAFTMTLVGACEIWAVIKEETRARLWLAVWQVGFWTFCAYVISRADVRFPGVVLCPTYSIAMFWAVRRIGYQKGREEAPVTQLSDEERRKYRLGTSVERIA